MKQFGQILRINAIVSCLAALPAAATIVQVVGQIAAPHAAFVNVVPSALHSGHELIVSRFGVLGGDAIERLPLPTSIITNPGELRLKTVTSYVNWPNEATPVPEEIFGANYLAFGTGFLVPGRGTGDVLIVHMYEPIQFVISRQKPGFFYHRIVWVDMNGDGRLDALTARARRKMLGGGEGELVWLEQPADDPRQVWQEHVIAHGPDVHFVVSNLAGDGSPVIIAAEFFAKRLTIYWRESGKWCVRVIDDKLGAAFDLALADLNLDGQQDLVVTNHEAGRGGAVYAYQIPWQYKTEKWRRHTLLANIEVQGREFNAAAPGSPMVWQTSYGGKPRIIVAGDGSHKVHLLEPLSQAQDDWRYSEQILLHTESTIGTPWLGKLKENEAPYLFVPSYDEGKIYVLQLQAE